MANFGREILAWRWHRQRRLADAKTNAFGVVSFTSMIEYKPVLAAYMVKDDNLL
jgi:hypothetical protein